MMCGATPRFVISRPGVRPSALAPGISISCGRWRESAAMCSVARYHLGIAETLAHSQLWTLFAPLPCAGITTSQRARDDVPPHAPHSAHVVFSRLTQKRAEILATLFCPACCRCDAKRAEPEHARVYAFDDAVASGHDDVGEFRKTSPLVGIPGVPGNMREQCHPYVMRNCRSVAIRPELQHAAGGALLQPRACRTGRHNGRLAACGKPTQRGSTSHCRCAYRQRDCRARHTGHDEDKRRRWHRRHRCAMQRLDGHCLE